MNELKLKKEELKLTVIIPVYNEAKTLYYNITEIAKVLIENNLNYKILLVNDGSRDESWEIINNLTKEYNVVGLNLSRNFGKEAAVCARNRKF